MADHSWGELQRKVQAVGRASARESEALKLMQRLDAARMGHRSAAGGKPSRPQTAGAVRAGTERAVAPLRCPASKPAANAMIGFAGGINCLTTFDGYRPADGRSCDWGCARCDCGHPPGALTAQAVKSAFWERPGLLLTPAGKRRALVPMETLCLRGFGPRLPQAVRELHQKITAA